MFELKRAMAVAGVCGMLALAAQVAQAGNGRSIRVDAGDARFDESGEIWFGVNEVDFASKPLTTGTLPFALNFSGAAGPGEYYSYQFAGYPLSAASLVIGYDGFPDDNWAAILPYFYAGSPPFTNWSSGDWSIGQVDTEAPFRKSEVADAIRFTWKGQSTDGTFIAAQVVFLDRGRGDFDIEFNYGQGPSFDFPAGGSQSANFGPDKQFFASYGKVAFAGLCFRGGVGDICAPVPEPATYSLWAAGMLLLAPLALWRRRRGSLKL